VPIVSVGASDPLLIPRSAKYRPDPPRVHPLARPRGLSLSLSLSLPSFYLCLFLPPFADVRLFFAPVATLPSPRVRPTLSPPRSPRPPSVYLALLHAYAQYTVHSRQCPTRVNERTSGRASERTPVLSW